MAVKKVKYIEGDFLRIGLTNNLFFYGRLFKNQTLCVYDYSQDKSELNISLDELNHKPKLFYVHLTDSALKSGDMQGIGNMPLSNDDILNQPPEAWIDIVNPNNCILLYPDGREVKATPEMCVGLERVSAWSYLNVVDRLKKHIDLNK